MMRTADEWDEWYQRPDPWGYEGTAEDVVRVQRLLDGMRYARFRYALDVGCGEGWVTDALSRLAGSTLGVDISTKAIERARERFPHIRFETGDLLETLRRADIRSIPFDLVVASEVLYYLQSDTERSAAVEALAALGVPSCLFCFSIIVHQEIATRRYFTPGEFLELLRPCFNVVGWFPSVAVQPPVLRMTLRAGARSRLAVRALDGWTRTRRPEQCRHVGYFAVKH